MKICVYAFANTAYFFQRLIEQSYAHGDAVKWSAVLPRWHHRKSYQSLLPDDSLLYLYQDFDRLYAEHSGDDAFGLAAEGDGELLCLLKDKAGYRFLDSAEQLRRAATLLTIYRTFLERIRPDILVFPDVEVVDGFLLLSLCKTLGITPVYYVGMRTLGGGFFSSDCYETLPPYFGPYKESDVPRAVKFLEQYRAGQAAGFEDPLPSTPAVPSQPLWRRAPAALLSHFRHERLYAGEDGWVNRVKANVARQINNYRTWYFRVFQEHLFDLHDDRQQLPENYVLYALQYTPESSINGLEPYYVDQTRAIDLLLAGMPSGYRLVIKEHPAIAGVRSSGFYRGLRSKPGVLLAAPALSTRRLIERTAAVATVTGTVGFEGYLLGKRSILFGRNFFSHLCACGEGPTKIKATFRSMLDSPNPDVDERAVEIARLLHIRYPILLADPLVQPEILSDTNIGAFRVALYDHVARLGSLMSSEKA